MVIAGWDQGNHEAELRSAAAAAPARADIQFAGPQCGSAKAAAYRHADAFILPSFSEGLPLVVLEAWAHRLPVLMADACNLPQGFAAEATLKIATDPESIVRSINSFNSLPSGELQNIGERGRQLVVRFGPQTGLHRRLIIFPQKKGSPVASIKTSSFDTKSVSGIRYER